MNVAYLLIIPFMVLIMALYLYMARRFNIIDRPHERGSHTRPTIRGGGILFPIAALIWFVLYGWRDPWAIFGLLLISGISFMDDVKNVTAIVRIMIHLVAVSLLFYDIGIFKLYWYWIALAYLLTIGCINAYNFMDGINGMTAFYGLVVLGTFSLLNNACHLLAPFFEQGTFDAWRSFFPDRLIGVIFVSLLVFAFFNARKKALAFAGDVGSISIAFLMSWLMISLMVVSREFFWILLFAVYGIETGYTILIRLSRGENILEPHRLHLYQLLANEKGKPHLWVSFIYALIQLVINGVVVVLIFNGLMTTTVFFIILFALVATYAIIRNAVTKNLSAFVP